MNLFSKALNGVEDALIPPAVKQQRSFVRPPQAAQATLKFARPKAQKAITIGQSNATDASKQPKGTIFGATPQQKALNTKLK